MQKNRLWLNPNKNQVAVGLGFPGSRNMFSLVLYGILLPQKELVYKVGVLWTLRSGWKGLGQKGFCTDLLCVPLLCVPR